MYEYTLFPENENFKTNHTISYKCDEIQVLLKQYEKKQAKKTLTKFEQYI